MSKLLLSTTLLTRKEFADEGNELIRVIEERKEDVNQVVSKYNRQKAVCESLEKIDVDEFIRQGRRAISKVSRLADVEKVAWDTGVILKIVTRPLVVRGLDKEDVGVDNYEIGRFAIYIDFSVRPSEFLRHGIRTVNLSYTCGDCHAPCIEDGFACWGNMQDDINRNLLDGDLYEMVKNILDFIKSPNSDNGYRSHSHFYSNREASPYSEHATEGAKRANEDEVQRILRAELEGEHIMWSPPPIEMFDINKNDLTEFDPDPQKQVTEQDNGYYLQIPRSLRISSILDALQASEIGRDPALQLHDLFVGIMISAIQPLKNTIDVGQEQCAVEFEIKADIKAGHIKGDFLLRLRATDKWQSNSFDIPIPLMSRPIKSCQFHVCHTVFFGIKKRTSHITFDRISWGPTVSSALFSEWYDSMTS